MKNGYKIVKGKIVLQDFLKEEEDKEKSHYRRDIKGRFALEQHAVPAKAMRQFLTDLSDKHGNVGVKDALRHYDSIAKIQELSREPATETSAEPATVADTPVLDQIFKTDYIDPPAPAEIETGFDFYYIQRFKYNPLFADIVGRVQDKLAGFNIHWEEYEDWHLTLLYIKGADEMKIANLALFVEEFQPVPISFKGYGYFNNTEPNTGFVLYAAVELTPELSALQRKMYTMAKAMMLETSEYSNPAFYHPHITLGYAPYAEYPEDYRPYTEIRGLTLEPMQIEACVEHQVLGISPNRYRETA